MSADSVLFSRLRSPRLPALAAVALVVSLALFGQGLRQEFAFDDSVYLHVNRDSLRGPWHELLFRNYWGEIFKNDPLYRPLTAISLKFNLRMNTLLGLDAARPPLFKLTNILLHALASMLAWLLLRRIFGLAETPALLAFAVFLVHPVHTEPVLSSVARSEIMSFIFGSSFLLLLGAPGLLPLACCSLLFGLLSKESTLSFAAMALFLDIYHRRRPRLPAYAAILGTVLFWWLMRHWSLHAASRLEPHFIDNPLFYAGAAGRLLTALHVQALYLAGMIHPGLISFDYSFAALPALAPSDWRGWLAAAILIGLVSSGLLAWRGKGVFFLLVFSWLASALPSSNLLFPIGTVMSFRLFYTPSLFVIAGLAGLAILAARLFPARFPALRLTAAAAALCVLSAYAVELGSHWKNEQSLFEFQTRRTPDNCKAQLNLANQYLRKNEDEKALAAYRRSVSIYPPYRKAWRGLGKLAMLRKDYQEAYTAYKKVLGEIPKDWEAHLFIGISAQRLGRTEEAAGHYRAVLEINPSEKDALLNLGAIHFQKGDFRKSRELWEKALEIDPSDEMTKANLRTLQVSEATRSR